MYGETVGYMYRADLYCMRHGAREAAATYKRFDLVRDGGNGILDPETVLDELAFTLEIDRDDEYSFDSDEFPKVVTRDMETGDAGPDFCAVCGNVLDVSWTGEAVDYAAARLAEYVLSHMPGSTRDHHHGDRDILDQLADRLAGCIGDAVTDRILGAYQALTTERAV